MGNSTSRVVVTVDGLGASGKSSLAAGLARRLGYGHLNSGLLYRAVAYLALSRGFPFDDERGLEGLLDVCPVGLVLDSSVRAVVVTFDAEMANDVDLTTEEISAGASIVARYSGVRSRLLEVQRKAFEPDGVVAEGRDMGTVVFPEAQVKFFVVAALATRAERRFRQLLSKGQGANLEQIQRELQERDERDATREVAPMKPASGAIIIDNSSGPIEETVERMYVMVMSCGAGVTK